MGRRRNRTRTRLKKGSVGIPFAAEDDKQRGAKVGDLHGFVVRDELVGIEIDLVLLYEAADAGDFRHAVDRGECVAQEPVLHATQLGQVAIPGLVDERVLEDRPDARGVGTDRRITAVRQSAPNVLEIFDLVHAIRASNNEVEGRLLEFSAREYMVRGRGYLTSLEDIASRSVRMRGARRFEWATWQTSNSGRTCGAVSQSWTGKARSWVESWSCGSARTRSA